MICLSFMPELRTLRCTAALVATLAAGVGVDAASAESATCRARSGPAVVSVVELYTSEGCNSCPPAERWLSSLKGRSDVLPLAFHVDYWDRLGWKDRFASPAYTRRQVEQQSVNGARFPYTPQIVVDGRDRQAYPRGDGGAARAASVAIELTRDGDAVRAQVMRLNDAPTRLAAYWAVTESGHRTQVKAGENDGVTLAHDFVVREYQPVPAWDPSGRTPKELRYTPSGAADPAHPRQVNLVVVDGSTGRPLQGLALGC